MRREWSSEDVVACWTPVGSDWDLVANKSGPTRLGFVLMLKFFELEGRFPPFVEEFPQAAVDYVADVVKVPTEDLAKYDLSSRSAKGHRTQIRAALGFRPATRADEERLTAWLADEVCPVELVEDRLREALFVQCRSDRIEPPGRVERIVTAARARSDRAFCAQTGVRLGEVCAGRLLALVAEGNEDGAALLASLKRDPGAVGLDSLLTEITKLTSVRQLGLPDGVFADCSEKLVTAWRARAIKMYPSDFRDAGEDVRTTLLAALCASRQAEITDALVELLVALVHKINARAERRVERQLTWEDLDLAGGTASIRRTLQRTNSAGLTALPTKTQSSERRIALPTPCLRSLEQHLNRQRQEREAAGAGWKDSGYVFTRPDGAPIEGATLTRHFNTLLHKARLRRIRFHDLRHSAATLLLEQGVELVVIKELLGHAHIGVTATVYAHVRLRLQRDAIDILSNALRHAANSTAEPDDGDDPPLCAAPVR
ncbi:DUF4158 domain-containing protein [Streptomyces mirabilis]|uniref:DUF4158 domain-containing protein n=1 Tax=Streptomyces mirabilis TaxID=68239 RepID=UPI0033DCB5D7